MRVFKIRMTAANQDDFIREIEIKASASFKNLHDFIVKMLKLDKNELASFFIADENWNRLQEIMLIDMFDSENQIDDGDNPQRDYLLMDKVKLGQLVGEVDDKIVYEYDFLQMHTFLLEVFDVVNTESAPATPQITYSEGHFNLKENLKIEKDPEKLVQELLKGFELLASDENDDDDLGSWNDDD